MPAQPIPCLTPQEYLEIERKATFKSEYYRGYMWPLGGEPSGMAGGRFEHSLISGNMVRQLGNLVGETCYVLPSDQRIRVSEEGLYTYADASVVCGEPIVFEDDTLENPSLIVEVLSDSTQANDRGFKFEQYQEIESFREYLLIAQPEPRVDVFRRDVEGKWSTTRYVGLDTVIPLESLNCSIRTSEIYLRVKFPFVG